MTEMIDSAPRRGGRQRGVVAVLPRLGPSGRRVAWLPTEWPKADADRWAAIHASAAARASRRIVRRAAEPLPPAAGWSPSARTSGELAYGLWLAWLAHVGELDPAEQPGVRVSVDRVDRFAAFLRETGAAPTGVGFRLAKMTAVLDSLDPQGAPGRQWLRRFATSHPGRKSEERSMELATRISPQDLLALGRRLMAEGDALAARKRARVGVRGAVAHRDGLVIALQALLALRPRNLLALRDGETIERMTIDETKDARSGAQVRFAGVDMKGRRPFATTVPPELLPDLDRHVAVHRPRLVARAQHGAAVVHSLWVTDRGLELRGSQLWSAVTRRIEAAFGFRVSPHEFRHVLTSTIAIEAPGMMGVVPAALGHADERPVLEHYDLGTQFEAGRRWTRQIADDRADAVSAFRQEAQRRGGSR